MTIYLEPNDEGAFLDHPRMEPSGNYNIECPLCKGHGGWNMRLNAYPLHGKENNPANRHQFSHFRCICRHCNGWGYVDAATAAKCQGHDWVFVRNTGNCLNLYECKHCGEKNVVDSSG